MYIIDNNFMLFLSNLSAELKWKYYFSFDNENDALVVINAKTGTYDKFDLKLVEKYLEKPKEFASFVL